MWIIYEFFQKTIVFRWRDLYNNHYLPFCERCQSENIDGLPMTSSSFFAARKEHRPYYKKHRKVYSALYILFIVSLITYEYIG